MHKLIFSLKGVNEMYEIESNLSINIKKQKPFEVKIKVIYFDCDFKEFVLDNKYLDNMIIYYLFGLRVVQEKNPEALRQKVKTYGSIKELLKKDSYHYFLKEAQANKFRKNIEKLLSKHLDLEKKRHLDIIRMNSIRDS